MPKFKNQVKSVSYSSPPLALLKIGRDFMWCVMNLGRSVMSFTSRRHVISAESRAYADFLWSSQRQFSDGARSYEVNADVDTFVVDAIRHLALVDDRAPDFVGRWTPTSEEYRCEFCSAPRGIFDTKLDEMGCADPFSLVAAEVSSSVYQCR